ncbi:MAG TPA: GNAT family N-acetyltransferase [Clostridia bacterium]|nr:GNAT family N-acetyltransferase [Clostridia bacterium]
MIRFLKASEEDAESLVKIQIRAFSIDVDFCGEGPPGYDSVERQIELMGSHIYYKIVDEDKLIGGFYIHSKQNGYYEIIRLFVEPTYQGKGIGCMALKYIEELFDDLGLLELEASDFRKDNHAFYKSRGYVKVGEKEYSEGGFSYIYQKIF